MALRARDIMESQVVTVSPNDPLSSVRRLFVDEGISGAPVVDEELRVKGVISSTDLLRAAAEGRDASSREPHSYRDGLELHCPTELEDVLEERLRDHRVEDFMTGEVVAAEPETPVSEVARSLRENAVHRVLVIEDGFLRGIISSFDLVALVEKLDI